MQNIIRTFYHLLSLTYVRNNVKMVEEIQIRLLNAINTLFQFFISFFFFWKAECVQEKWQEYVYITTYTIALTICALDIANCIVSHTTQMDGYIRL